MVWSVDSTRSWPLRDIRYHSKRLLKVYCSNRGKDLNLLLVEAYRTPRFGMDDVDLATRYFASHCQKRWQSKALNPYSRLYI